MIILNKGGEPLLSDAFYEHLNNVESRAGADFKWNTNDYDDDPDFIWCKNYLENRRQTMNYYYFLNDVMRGLTSREHPSLNTVIKRNLKKTNKKFVPVLKKDEYFQEYLSLIKKHRNHYVLNGSRGIDDSVIYSSKSKAFKDIRDYKLDGQIPYPYVKVLCQKYLRGKEDIA